MIEQEKKYKCIKEFALDEYECPIEGEEFIIPMDSVWFIQEYSYISDVRLENDDMGWLEIPKEDLQEYFIEI